MLRSKVHWIQLAVVLALLCAAALPFVSTSYAQSGTPFPAITGPIPITETSYPFLDQLGPPRIAMFSANYVEEEYFISGNANVYTWDANNNPIVRTPDAPYTTRIIVRKPDKPAHFSGTVWVEFLNPTLAFDLDRMWELHYAQILKDGDAWVGITSKPIAIVALKNFDPVRYAPLSMANPLPPDQQTCGRLPGEPGYSANSSKLYENGLIWDAMSQLGALLRSDSAQNPLGAPATTVYGEGWSQTGGYAYRYLSTFGSSATLANGSRIFDGWLVGGPTGPTAINQCTSVPSSADPRQQIRPSGVPVISFRTESDSFSFNYRRADGDDPRDQFRLYEIAGVSHDSATIYENFPTAADAAKAQVTIPSTANCGINPPAVVIDLPYEYFFNAGAILLENWNAGMTPPYAPRYVYEGSTIVRDAYGNAIGGLRSPYVDVPISTYKMPTGGACPFIGSRIPFTHDLLAEIYKNHGDYVNQVSKGVQDLLQVGFVLPMDASKITFQAAQADVP